MTAIGYISPQNVPALTGDTMISTQGILRENTVFPMPVSMTGATEFPAALARKVYILSEKTAVTLAGDVAKISDFLSTASTLIQPLEQMDRPMRYLGDLANEIKDIELIGVTVQQDRINSVAPDGLRIDKLFGYYAVAGSGCQEYLDYLNHIRDMAYNSKYGGRPDIPYEFIRSVASGWSTHLLRDEIFTNTHKKTWGGISEYVMYDFSKARWRYGWSNITLFFKANELSDGIWTTNMLPLAVLYKPGETGEHGYVCSINTSKDQYAWWRLMDLLKDNNEQPPSFRDIWATWRPDTVSIKIEFIGAKTFPPASGKNLEWNEVSEINFLSTSESMTWSMSKTLQDELSEMFCSIRGLTYRSSR